MSYETLVHELEQMQHDLELAVNENLKLKQKLDKAKEALRFYADPNCYSDFGRDGLSEVDEDCGELAQKVLEEIGDE